PYTSVSIWLSADAARDLVEDLRGARQQMIRPGADYAGNIVARVGSMREDENVVAQANVISEPGELPTLLTEMAEVFDVVAKQADGGYGAMTTLRHLADACRVRAMRNEGLQKARTTGL
ncbi:MAG: hypothetical protein M3440_10425, partial [Chloroflexota bacterium]|nr:hypothetical protein [Chloroflexota bacterium]